LKEKFNSKVLKGVVFFIYIYMERKTWFLFFADLEQNERREKDDKR